MRFFWAMLLAFPLAATDIAVAPSSLSFTYAYTSQIVVPGAIVIASPQSASFTATRPAADSWVVLPANSQNATPATFTGTAPVVLPISFDPGKLASGKTYTSAVTLRFPQGTITVPVTLQVTLGTIVVTDPAVLFFDPLDPFQNVAVGLSNPAIQFLLGGSTTTPWLNVTGLKSPLVVTASASKAPPGVSVGSIQVRAVSVQPAANNPLTIPAVYLGASLASVGPLTMSPSSVSFAGAGTQQVAVTGGTFTAVSDSKWLTATVSGQTLTLKADPAGLAAGSYQGAITLASGGVLQLLPVALSVTAAPPPSLEKVVNAASWSGSGIAPGELVVLGGSNLAPAGLATLTLDPDGTVSRRLAGVQVLVNGVAAPIVYVSPTQVAVAAPYELDGAATASFVLTVNGQQSNALAVPVVAAAPGIFAADASGAGPGAILNGDTSVNGPGRGAAKGEVVAIYMTGEGQTTPAGATGKVTGPPPVPRQNVSATVDGQPAEVRFAGDAPGLISGVLQVNVVVPGAARSGEVPVVVTIGGVPSQNGVTVSVR